MPNPPKSTELLSDRLSKAEREARAEMEKKLKGGEANLTPSKHLNAAQKKVFQSIVAEIGPSGILGSIDIYILDIAAIAIERLQAIEKLINQDFSNLYSRELMAAKTKYTADFFQAVNQLCLSPSSRAKMSGIAAAKAQEQADPLLKVLNGGQ